MPKALLIAFHYPPVKGSSGLQRTLRYSIYLKQYGWQVQVLTVSPRAHEAVSDDEIADIPEDVTVHRALAFDAKRHFSVFGSYPGFLAKPDRWASWYFDGVRRGRRIIRNFQPDLIWSTFPIPTAHRIGLSLSKHSGIPWVADFRDLMTEENWPGDVRERAACRAFETDIIEQAVACTFTTPGATRYYNNLFGEKYGDKFHCLLNGYDEQSFDGIRPGKCKDSRRVFLHAGVMYPQGRDPEPLFIALARLRQRGILTGENFVLRLRATANDDEISLKVKRNGVEDLVELAAALPYREVLQEMMDAEALLLFQGHNFNRQIPAKLYEYFRAGRPVIALTNDAGDTAWQVRQAEGGVICTIDDVDAIETKLSDFLSQKNSNANATPSPEHTERYSRENQTAELADLFNSLIKQSS